VASTTITRQAALVSAAASALTGTGTTYDHLLLVRKLGVPGHPELAMGAIASGGVRIIGGRAGLSASTMARARAAGSAQGGCA
jgi:predicted phosphoribosyltransferase